MLVFEGAVANHVGSKHRATSRNYPQLPVRTGPQATGASCGRTYQEGMAGIDVNRDILLTVCFGRGTKNTEWNTYRIN